ncbi:MAG: hypothetical protein ACRDM1_13755 [Gaiellaceae bacterium]
MLVLPPEERWEAISRLPPFAPPPVRRPSPVAEPAGDEDALPLAQAILRYAAYRAIAVSLWYVGIALGIGVLTALLARP